MRKHTPGPWEWVETYNRDTDNGDHRGSIKQADKKVGGYICAIDDIGGKEEPEANALLISASPETLKSLKEMRDVCAAGMRVISRNILSGEFASELVKAGIKSGFGVRADNAVAKATGKEIA